MTPENNTPNNNRDQRPAGIFTDRNIIDDPKAPQLYTRYTIRFFAIFFSTLLGGILMAINFNRLKRSKKEIFMVVLFSFLFTSAAGYLYGYFGAKFTNIIIIMNLVGSGILEEFFWNRVIGRQLKYRRQNVWPVLLVVLLISLPLFFAAM